MGLDHGDSNTLKLNKSKFYGTQVVSCSLPPQLAVEGVVGLESLARGNLEVGVSVHIWDLAFPGAEAAAAS